MCGPHTFYLLSWTILTTRDPGPHHVLNKNKELSECSNNRNTLISTMLKLLFLFSSLEAVLISKPDPILKSKNYSVDYWPSNWYRWKLGIHMKLQGVYWDLIFIQPRTYQFLEQETLYVLHIMKVQCKSQGTSHLERVIQWDSTWG